MAKNRRFFRPDFLWGASTSSHQVEGNTHNQWTVWELEVAARQAHSARKRLGSLMSWEEIRSAATDPANYVSGAGIDHYSRYKDDFTLLKKLNLNSFRFSIEWSRIEPREGQWDNAELTHYKKYIAELRKQGIEPVLNLWHWTVPVWFSDIGGFARRANVVYFERYVTKLAEELDLHDFKYIITLNEPNVFDTSSYGLGDWPPQEHNWWHVMKVYLNLIAAHKVAYRVVKTAAPKVHVGVASQLANIQAKRPHNLWDEIATQWMRYAWNWWFLNRIKHHQDFIGVNYYFSDYYRGFRRANPNFPQNDLGWYMEPEGLYPLLVRVWAHYKKPIIITENGVADASDRHRKWWLGETMVALERAVSEGVDIRGYFHWSLLDNFEWAMGWWPRFGLVAVDRKTLKRSVRPSAVAWSKQLAQLQAIAGQSSKK